jgi:uncharacterized protein (TIGR02118 family)
MLTSGGQMMFKVVGLGRRREGTSHDECIKHWFGQHAQLARGLPGLRKYVISEVGQSPAGEPSEWDGMAELWFDSMDDYVTAMRSDAGRATSADGGYLSRRLMLYVGDEREIV